MSHARKQSKADPLFLRACAYETAGKARSAFRLMLAAAELGDIGAQLNVGNYYIDGTGVQRNRSAALYWYRRASRRGDASAAHNIGILWQSEGKFQRALDWFQKAVTMGDDESNLDIGKHLLCRDNNPERAIRYLRKITRDNRVSEACIEETAQLLREAKKRLRVSRRPAIK
jgi:TPR repeat protein